MDSLIECVYSLGVDDRSIGALSGPTQIAFGLDRIAMLLTKSASIRDVIAFPKTQKATCMMTQAPSEVDSKQMKELKLKFDLS